MRRVQTVKKHTKLICKNLLTDKQQVEFALRRTDEDCRSIVECGCPAVKRERTKALYKYDTNKPDAFMLKDVNESLTYLRSRGEELPFLMLEKDDFVWFDAKEE